MKHLLQRAATQLKKRGRFGSLQIIAGLVSANVAGAALGHLQALGHIAAGAISDCIGGQILQSVPALAGMGGGAFDFGSLTGQVVAGAAGAALTIMVGVLKNFMFRMS